MIRKITLLTLILLCGTALAVRAQSLASFKEHLATSAANGARVTATEHGAAARSLLRASQEAQRARIRGYRVCIFFDNGPEARSGAQAACKLFEEQFPGIKAQMAYDVPYFRVTVGNCLTVEEAIILKGRIAATFPKAFPKSEELALTDFLN